jgi:hypothetical protein
MWFSTDRKTSLLQMELAATVRLEMRVSHRSDPGSRIPVAVTVRIGARVRSRSSRR